MAFLHFAQRQDFQDLDAATRDSIEAQLRDPNSIVSKRLNAQRNAAAAEIYFKEIILANANRIAADKSSEKDFDKTERRVQTIIAVQAAREEKRPEPKKTQREEEIRKLQSEATAQLAAVEKQVNEVTKEITAVEQESAKYINKKVLHGEFDLSIPQTGIVRTAVIDRNVTEEKAHAFGTADQIGISPKKRNLFAFNVTAARNNPETQEVLESTTNVLKSLKTMLQAAGPVLALYRKALAPVNNTEEVNVEARKQNLAEANALAIQIFEKFMSQQGKQSVSTEQARGTQRTAAYTSGSFDDSSVRISAARSQTNLNATHALIKRTESGIPTTGPRGPRAPTAPTTPLDISKGPQQSSGKKDEKEGFVPPRAVRGG